MKQNLNQKNNEELLPNQRYCPNPNNNDKCNIIITHNTVYARNGAHKNKSLCKPCAGKIYADGTFRKHLVENICNYCNIIYLCEEFVERKYCSYDCYHKADRGKISPKKGKTNVELYGNERALEINSMSVGRNNGSIKRILKNNNITYEEYLNILPKKEAYYRSVNLITNKQPIYLLTNYNKRGRSGKPGAYQLDHIYPISKGFENNIPPELIGDINNLQFIPWRENITKNRNLFDYYDYKILTNFTSSIDYLYNEHI